MAEERLGGSVITDLPERARGIRSKAPIWTIEHLDQIVDAVSVPQETEALDSPEPNSL
jgi:hypothetical protein